MDWKGAIKNLLGKQAEPPKTVRVGDLNAYATRPAQPRQPDIQNKPTGIEINGEFQRAIDLIEAGAPLLFITGKAGTGKSTFIEYFRNSSRKNIAVVAPTGVSALNARGQTIHSFFRFPRGPIDLNSIKPLYDRRLFERLELLVVDEVSMVRADLVDAMERFLRINTGRTGLPFGGVQIILVGDLFQLPPVVSTAEEARLFAGGKYASPFFFSAHSLQEQPIAFVEMHKVYRQEQEHFVRLLNAVREDESAIQAVEELNRVCLNSVLNSEPRLALTPTNAVAGRINARHIAELKGEERIFEGLIDGNFNIQQERLPAPFKLQLKFGAQVMFVKNDSNRRWVNGSIGIVKRFTEKFIQVAVNNGEQLHHVQQENWETLKYRYDPSTDAVVTEVIGRYTQFPLMLAWAVTIHKSQGQTLDRILLDLKSGAFAPGQLYVALSRCRTLEGIQLQRPIQRKDVKVDERIKRFYEMMRRMG